MTAPEVNKSTAETFAARLAQANLTSIDHIANNSIKETDFDDKT